MRNMKARWYTSLILQLFYTFVVCLCFYFYMTYDSSNIDEKIKSLIFLHALLYLGIIELCAYMLSFITLKILYRSLGRLENLEVWYIEMFFTLGMRPIKKKE